MSDNFEGWRVTALCRPEYSFGHNLRLPDFIENQKHIDSTRPHKVLLHLGDERECYEKVFGESIKKYNSKQKRKDRRITDYYQKVLDDERVGTHKNPKANADRKPFYEFHFYIGNRDSHCPDEKAERILSLYVQKVMPKKFSNFVPVSIAVHNDEYSFDRKGNRLESPIHVHVVGVFVAHALTDEEMKEEKEYREKCKILKKEELKNQGIEWDEKEWKKKNWRKEMIDRWGKSLEKGMELQTSMSAACNEMGFFTGKGQGTAQQQFEEAVRHDLMDFAEDLGVKVNRNKGYSHSHKEKEVYIQEQNNIEKEKELEEFQKVLEAKEIELENRIDDFDYKIEHLEELEKNLSRKESDLISREDKITNEEESINQKIKVISEEKTKIDYKEKFQSEKDFDQQFREENLKQQETRLKEKEKRLLQKEIDVEKRAEKVNEIAVPLEEKEQRLSELENDLSEREKVILEKEKNAIEKEALVNKKLIEARNEKQLSENARIEAKELYEKNREQIEKFNFENQDKIKKIDEWETAAKEINESEDWIKNEFNEYNKNRYTENAFQKFYQKIKTGVAAAISKVKESYDKKIKDLKERLFGHKKIFHKGNKIVCVYSYGESDYADMLRDTPVSDIEQAIADTRKKGKQTFSEAAAQEEGFSFYERYFSKAKTLTKEREIELRKERERASISR